MHGCNSVGRSLVRVTYGFVAILLFACDKPDSSGRIESAATSHARAATPESSLQPAPTSIARARMQMLDLPLRFERNDGQFAAGVRYMARADGLRVELDDVGATLSFSETPRQPAQAADTGGDLRQPSSAKRRSVAKNSTVALRMRVRGASRDARPGPGDELVTKSNYLIGNDPSRWRKRVPNYDSVRYRDTLPGVGPTPSRTRPSACVPNAWAAV
jgi:hypothetical protein